MEATALQSFLTTVGTVSETVLDIAGSTVNFIVENPILLVPVAISVVGSGIGLFKMIKG